MRGTEISAEASDPQGEVEPDGTGGVPGGGEPHWVDAFIMGEDGVEKGGEPSAGQSHRDRWDGRFHRVYALIDSRTATIFYVGYTRQWPRDRLRAHCHDPVSAAYIRIREIWAEGGLVRMTILATYRTRAEALFEEARQIKMRVGLVNRSEGSGWGAGYDMECWEAPTELVYEPFEELP